MPLALSLSPPLERNACFFLPLHVLIMADLLKYLLTSLDTSHVSEVLTNFITDSGLKTTDSGFLESLKTVLIALREKGNLGESLVNKILHDICFPLLYNKEFASSDKTQHRRQCLHQAYDLIALCCSIYPDNFLVEVCERCIQAVGAFIEKNGKDLEIVGDALDISVALDLIGYLIKCEGQGKEGGLLTEELEEKIFQHILRLLPHTSETLCAKLTSVILPSFLEAKQKERIKVRNGAADIFTSVPLNVSTGHLGGRRGKEGPRMDVSVGH